jgi:hypothetical protein
VRDVTRAWREGAGERLGKGIIQVREVRDYLISAGHCEDTENGRSLDDQAQPAASRLGALVSPYQDI